MPKLNQIIAVEKGVKSRSFQELTEAHHALQKPTLLSGISRTYRPKDEEGEQLPPESTKVQVKAEEVVRETAAILTKLFDVTAIKDLANCVAKADVVIDGRAIFEKRADHVPAVPREAVGGFVHVCPQTSGFGCIRKLGVRCERRLLGDRAGTDGAHQEDSTQPR